VILIEKQNKLRPFFVKKFLFPITFIHCSLIRFLDFVRTICDKNSANYSIHDIECAYYCCSIVLLNKANNIGKISPRYNSQTSNDCYYNLEWLVFRQHRRIYAHKNNYTHNTMHTLCTEWFAMYVHPHFSFY